MKFLVTVGLALVALTVESVRLKYVDLGGARIDVAVVLVAFLALRVNTLEGAISSFTVGYLLDVMSGRPTGLFIFLAVLLFLLGRLAASLVDVQSRLAFMLFVMGADAAHMLLSAFFSWMVSSEGAVQTSTLVALPLQVLLTGATALGFHPLLRRLIPEERPRPGVLL